MAKYRYRVNQRHPAGFTFSDEVMFDEGIIKTLLHMNVIEKVNDELDPATNDKPAKSGGKPRRSKGTSKGRGNGTRRANRSAS